MRSVFLSLVASSATTSSALLMKEKAQTSAAFTLKEQEAAKQGFGLPGCDLDTYVRYKVTFCSGTKGEGGIKPLKYDSA